MNQKEQNEEMEIDLLDLVFNILNWNSEAPGGF